MLFAKRDAKGNVLGHFEASDEDVDAQRVWTHKVRGNTEERQKDRAATKAALKAPKGMKLLCVEEDASDEFGSHDLYVYGTDEIKFTDVDAVEELTPRVGFESALKTKEAASQPPTPA